MDPEEWEERCVTITSEIAHGVTGKGKSWMKWTTSQDIGHYFYDCSYAYRAFQAQWWKTDVFVTVVLRKVGVNYECDARSQYRSGVYDGVFAFNWTADTLAYCGGKGQYYTWAEVQAYDPSIWPGGWSPPVHVNSPPHQLPTTPQNW